MTERWMSVRFLLAGAMLLVLLAWGISPSFGAEELAWPPGKLSGSRIIDGYNFKEDPHPKGEWSYRASTGEFQISYERLKIRPATDELEAWLYDTDSGEAVSLGRAPYTGLTGSFTVKNLPQYTSGEDFGPYEILAFSAEKSGVSVAEPSGSDVMAVLKPAFYLFTALPNAEGERFFCGHGRDWSFISEAAFDRQICFD